MIMKQDFISALVLILKENNQIMKFSLFNQALALVLLSKICNLDFLLL